MKGRVLLLGSNDRSSLAVARSLGAARVQVEVARIGASSMCESSRYVARVVDLGDARRHLRRTADSLIEHLTQETYDLVIPMGDTAAELAAHLRDDINRRTRLAMPDRGAYALCHDKEQTLQVAKKLGIPAPAYDVLRRWEDLEDRGLSGLNLPCYLKPNYSARVVGDSIVKFRVRKARTEDEVLDFCRFNLGNTPIMLQQECPGVGAGIYLLANHGRVLSMVQQIRLHEPSDGGGSSYRTTVPLDPKLAEYAHAFVQESEWHGVAMIEFKGDPDRRNWFLMEVNGRFWGSLALTVRAGLDFPRWLYEMETGRVSPKTFTSVNPSLNVRQRHLRKDFGWLVTKLRRFPNRVNLVRSWISTFRHLLAGNEGLDSESARDPLPSLREWLAPLVTESKRATNVVRRVFCLVRYKVDEAAVVGEARRRLSNSRGNILFVCKGNICRSAFAEHYIRQRHSVSSVRSAGTLFRFGRRPPVALERMALRSFGVDMCGHRSQSFDSALVDWADIVVVMDYRNLFDLHVDHRVEKPVVLLGSLGGGGQIRDPYNRPAAETRQALDRIQHDVDILTKALGDKVVAMPRSEPRVA